MIQKHAAFATVMILLFSSLPAHARMDGYLMFAVSKLSQIHENGDDKPVVQKQEERKYIVALDDQFFAQFKNKPIPYKSSGTEFFCNLSADGDDSHGHSVHGTQWFSPPGDDGKIYNWYWASGTQNVNGKDVHLRDSQTNLFFKSWDAINSYEAYQFYNYDTPHYDRVVVTFDVHHVAEGSDELKDALIAEVQGTTWSNGSYDVVVPAGPKPETSLEVACRFQNN